VKVRGESALFRVSGVFRGKKFFLIYLQKNGFKYDK